MSNYIAPKFKTTAFNCPFCNAYAHQSWIQPFNDPNEFASANSVRHYSPAQNLFKAICFLCKNYSLWLNGKMIYPNTNGIEHPNSDLPENIKEIYYEAASIVNVSPRGAAALLRLALEELCIHLGEKNGNLNEKIGNLVSRGMPKLAQKSSDLVRIIGNNAVHPGEIDLTENPDTASKLFGLINIIAEQMISIQNQVDILFSNLPEGTIKSIDKRDSKSK